MCIVFAALVAVVALVLYLHKGDASDSHIDLATARRVIAARESNASVKRMLLDLNHATISREFEGKLYTIFDDSVLINIQSNAFIIFNGPVTESGRFQKSRLWGWRIDESSITTKSSTARRYSGP
jgi:hypothetical protein